MGEYSEVPCATAWAGSLTVAGSEQLGRDNREGRERDGRLDADNPLEDAKLGFRGERFQVGTRHCLRANRASDGFRPGVQHRPIRVRGRR